MNEANVNQLIYAQKVELLLRLIPIVMEEGVFAIHGGSAINLFLKNLPRYSVDLDLTYIPLADRATSIADINLHLKSICDKSKRAFTGMHIVPKTDTCKLLCESLSPSFIDQRDAMVNQFDGMTDVAFTYEEFEATRAQLVDDVKALMTEADREFLVSFESGQPEWDGYEFEYFKNFPSVQWKLLNLQKLAKQNPLKMAEEADKLRSVWER